jgi:haloalkane dehalogenase
MTAAHERSFSVSDVAYPFRDHWFERDGVAMHYVDEGDGTPVLMLHGNPTWSFLYRDVIKDLAGTCRPVVPDYPGFGFSEHPPGYGYTPQEHAEWVTDLIDHLHLDGFILVMQDWGGPIGMSVAVDRPHSVAGLVILNTWTWPPDWNLWSFSSVMGGPIGRYLHLRRNFFARRLVPWGIARKERKTPELLRAYTDPFPTAESRMGTYVFPRAIRKSASWLRSIEQRLSCLREKPIEMVWAMKDPAFGKESYIRRWQGYFPEAKVDRVDDASHYLQEDCPDRVAAAVRRLLDRVRASARPE